MSHVAAMSTAMVLEKPELLVERKFAVPRATPDDGILQVEMAGICHSDVEMFRGAVTAAPLPIIMGHEIVGRIADVGERAATRWGVAPGDRVAVESFVRCGYCRHCIEGTYKYCPNRQIYGTFTSCNLPPHLWGSYSDYLYLAPGAMVHKVPDTMSPELATLLTVAIANGIQWTILKGGAMLGDTVVVQGVGPIGLSAVAAARETGAGLIIATGLSRDSERLSLASEFGADVVIDVEQEDVVTRVREVSGGEMADVVLDVTGAASAIRASTKLARPMGTVVHAGLTGDGTLTPFELDDLLVREVRVQPVFAYEHDAVNRALKLVARNRYPFEKLITHYFPLSQAEAAVRMSGREVAGEEPIKVAILPDAVFRERGLETEGAAGDSSQRNNRMEAHR